jgi:hypothetical protein
MLVPSMNTDGTQFANWKTYDAIMYPERNDYRSSQTAPSSSNHYNFMTIGDGRQLEIPTVRGRDSNPGYRC